MLPGRVETLSRARTRRLRDGCGCEAGGAAIRLFAQASNHSSTDVTLTIHRPPINDALSSPFLIARLTVRCSHRAISATSWTVRYGLFTTTSTGLGPGPPTAGQTPNQPITQRAHQHTSRFGRKSGVGGGQRGAGPSAGACSSLRIRFSSSPATLLASCTASRTPSASSAVRRRWLATSRSTSLPSATLTGVVPRPARYAAHVSSLTCTRAIRSRGARARSCARCSRCRPRRPTYTL